MRPKYPSFGWGLSIALLSAFFFGMSGTLAAGLLKAGWSPLGIVVPRVGIGAAVMVVTQMAMVAIMTMTPVHMREHGHGLGDVGLVIGFHIGAMYLPSLVTGVLVDRVGRAPMVVAAAVTLLMAGVTAASAPADSLPLLVLALVLLGLGWNMGLISGTALVVDSTTLDNRARVQGLVDVGVALAGAGGGAASGLVKASTSYATLSLVGGALSLMLIPVVLWSISAGPGGQHADLR